MAIQIKFEQSDPIVLEGKIRGIDTQKDLESLFDGESYLNGSFVETYAEDDEAEQIISAEWVDDAPETQVHEYVLDYVLNDMSKTFSVARGDDAVAKPREWLNKYWSGFHEVVEEQINLEGLEFVFGNGFDLTILINLVVREVTREYLREYEIEV